MSVYESIAKDLTEDIDHETNHAVNVKMHKLSLELENVEKDKLAGKKGCTVEELDKLLKDIIENA